MADLPRGYEPAAGPDDGRPVIGVTSIPRVCGGALGELAHETSPELYLDALWRAGGAGVVLPVHYGAAVAIVDRLDGIVLTGGGDVAPWRSGTDASLVRAVDERRDEFEIAAVVAAVDAGVPVLAICRGIQVLNVALGGTLVSDLPRNGAGAEEHNDAASWRTGHHAVAVEPGSALFDVTGPSTVVNSLHHQAVERIAPRLQVAARAPDGVVEAVELEGRPFVLGLQWHAECMAPAEPHQGIFDRFVAEAALSRQHVVPRHA